MDMSAVLKWLCKITGRSPRTPETPGVTSYTDKFRERNAVYAMKDAKKAAEDAARAKKERDERIASLLKRAEGHDYIGIIRTLIKADKLDTAKEYLDQQEAGG